MENNIAKIKINYEVGIDIDELANDMAIYLGDALCNQYEGEECDLILDDGMNEATLLNAIGRVWQKQFAQKIIEKAMESEKGGRR